MRSSLVLGAAGDPARIGWQSASALAPTDAWRRRTLDLGLPPPAPGTWAVVAVPARDEAESLPRLVEALGAQRSLSGRRLAGIEVLVVVNNATDGSAEAARCAAAAVSHLPVHVAEVTLAPHEAHVGRARQIALDTAWARLEAVTGSGRGLLLTTDADTRPAPDWVAQNAAEMHRGADAVGGRILLCPADRASLPPALRRLVLLDAGYRRAVEHVNHLLAPDPHDPYPRHHQHFGGSLAVAAWAYARAGGIPAMSSLEDVAFVRALVSTGARLRHSDLVRVWTSGRRMGRTPAGLATEMARWDALAASGHPLLVESAAHVADRLRQLGQRRHQGASPPATLVEAPWPLPPGAEQDVALALADLRRLAAYLAPLSLDERLGAPPRPSRRLAA